MGLMSASYNQPAGAPYEGTYIQALAAEHVSDLEPLQVERISELEAVTNHAPYPAHSHFLSWCWYLPAEYSWV